MSEGVAFTGGGESDVTMNREYSTVPPEPSMAKGGPVESPEGLSDGVSFGNPPPSGAKPEGSSSFISPTDK